MRLDSVRAAFDVRDFAAAVWERWTNGQDVGDAMAAEFAALAVERVKPRLIEKMRAAGLPVPDDVDTLDADAIRQAINERTGLEIEDWSPDAIVQAVRERITRELSDALGVELEGVDLQDPESVKEAIRQAVVHQVKTGHATRFVTRAMIRKIRTAATWARAGIPRDDRKKIMARWYAKKYRRTHKQIYI